MRIKLLVALIGMLWICTSCTSSKKNEQVPTTNKTATAPLQVVQESKPLQSKTVIAEKKMTCLRTDDQRVVEIAPRSPEGCRLWYSKLGSRTSVASSVKGKRHCENVLDKIGENLKNAGFECIVAESVPVVQVTSESSDLSGKKMNGSSKTSESKKANN